MNEVCTISLSENLLCCQVSRAHIIRTNTFVDKFAKGGEDYSRKVAARSAAIYRCAGEKCLFCHCGQISVSDLEVAQKVAVMGQENRRACLLNTHH